MLIFSFLLGVLLTWLVMSGTLAQSLALLIRVFWPSSTVERELRTDKWLLNIPVQPSSSWRVLGYWRDTFAYRQACAQMAGLLADKACLSSQDNVLDVGFTSHDQLLVWLDYYQVNHLTAIASDEHLMAEAANHCGHFHALKLVRGGEKGLAEQDSDSCDKLLALDCTYRFKSRPEFFVQARRVLKPGGVLALTDMVLARAFQDRREQRLLNQLGRIAGISVAGMPIKETYERLLGQYQFEQVDILDITDDVLSGFCFWFGQHQQHLSSMTRSKIWLRLRLQVWFIRWMLHRKQLRYVMITAR